MDKKIPAAVTRCPENPFISGGETLNTTHFGKTPNTTHFSETLNTTQFFNNFAKYHKGFPTGNKGFFAHY